LNDNSSVVLTTISPKPPLERISLAPKTISNAKKIIVIIHGDNKRYVVSEILNKNQDLPIVKILSARKESEIFVHKNLI
jgi:6-phosphogluconolactonase/glucosamine-6-phosphate isomerase/deaminase